MLNSINNRKNNAYFSFFDLTPHNINEFQLFLYRYTQLDIFFRLICYLPESTLKLSQKYEKTIKDIITHHGLTLGC